jgi:hypothetical protein
MDLLIVERTADWSEWPRLTRTLSHPVHVLVQLEGESLDTFYDRVESRLTRVRVSPRRIVVLRAGEVEEIVLEPSHDDDEAASGQTLN